MPSQPRVLIVSEHASARFGGEAALPLHYFRVLLRRGYDVWLITHARTRDELSQTYPGEERIVYVEDTRLHILMWQLSKRLPGQIAYFTTGFVSRVAAQLEQRKLVRSLVAAHGIDLLNTTATHQFALRNPVSHQANNIGAGIYELLDEPRSEQSGSAGDKNRAILPE